MWWNLLNSKILSGERKLFTPKLWLITHQVPGSLDLPIKSLLIKLPTPALVALSNTARSFVALGKADFSSQASPVPSLLNLRLPTGVSWHPRLVNEVFPHLPVEASWGAASPGAGLCRSG